MRRMAFPLGQGEMTARDFLAEITTNCVKMKAQDIKDRSRGTEDGRQVLLVVLWVVKGIRIGQYSKLRACVLRGIRRVAELNPNKSPELHTPSRPGSNSEGHP